MKREEKREELLEANITDSANLYCQAVADDDCTVMLDQAYQYWLQQERERIMKIIDWAKEAYEEDQYFDWDKFAEKGEEKMEADSCCNEMLNYVLKEIEKEILEPLSE